MGGAEKVIREKIKMGLRFSLDPF